MARREVRIARHDSGATRWELAHASPARALRPHLTRYCGYRERSAVPMRRREVPSGEVAVILSLGPTIEVSDAALPAAPGRRLGSFVASLHDSASLTEYSGEQHGVEIGLGPLGARKLFGLPMHELTNQVVELDELWGRSAELLAERLHGAPGWEARFEILDAFLGARLTAGSEPAPEVTWAMGRLRGSRGRATIAGLVEQTGWSHRRLIGAFREQVGMAPKALARVLRFQEVARSLRDQGGERLAEIALSCGYYDQAHLNRDFRQFAATTPGEYAARVLPAGGGVAG